MKAIETCKGGNPGVCRGLALVLPVKSVLPFCMSPIKGEGLPGSRGEVAVPAQVYQVQSCPVCLGAGHFKQAGPAPPSRNLPGKPL